MASAYELAFLSDHIYNSSERQRTETFNVDDLDPYLVRRAKASNYYTAHPQKGDWVIETDTGISNHLYGARYRNLRTGESVVAFRGTGVDLDFGSPTKGITRTVNDLAVDVRHLKTRTSAYTVQAAAFLEKHYDNGMIVTGHSLGGFIAFAMAYHFKVKVAVFNPPYVVAPMMIVLEKLEQKLNSNFKTSKIIVFESSDDWVTKITRVFKTRPNNVKYMNLGETGGHKIGGMKKYTREHMRNDIVWNF
jgi:predicted esterase YcpF (UPF0227 family)